MSKTYVERIETLSLSFRECPGCKEVLPISDFAIERRQKTGLQTYCRRCRSRMYAERTRADSNNAG